MSVVGEPQPGHIWRALARFGFVRPGTNTVDDASQEEYLLWEAKTATGVWEYYSRFLPEKQEGLKILDVACGPGGRTLVHAGQSSAAFFALDRSGELQRANRALLRRANLQCVTGDAYDLPLSDGVVDAVLCENAMEHLTDPVRAISEMARVLKVGGLLFLVFPPWRSPGAGHLWSVTLFPWVHLLPEDMLLRFLEALALERGEEGCPKTWARGRLLNMKASLNQWALDELLGTLARSDLAYVSGYVVPEWRWAKLLSLVPWVGDCFASSVYVVLRKVVRAKVRRPTLLDLQRSTLPFVSKPRG